MKIWIPKGKFKGLKTKDYARILSRRSSFSSSYVIRITLIWLIHMIRWRICFLWQSIGVWTIFSCWQAIRWASYVPRRAASVSFLSLIIWTLVNQTFNSILLRATFWNWDTQTICRAKMTMTLGTSNRNRVSKVIINRSWPTKTWLQISHRLRIICLCRLFSPVWIVIKNISSSNVTWVSVEVLLKRSKAQTPICTVAATILTETFHKEASSRLQLLAATTNL